MRGRENKRPGERWGMVRKAKLSKRKRVDCKCERETVRQKGVKLEEKGVIVEKKEMDGGVLV